MSLVFQDDCVLQTFQVHHEAELQIQVFVELFVGACIAASLVFGSFAMSSYVQH